MPALLAEEASPQASDCFEGCFQGYSVVRCEIDGGVVFLGKHAVPGMVRGGENTLASGVCCRMDAATLWFKD